LKTHGFDFNANEGTVSLVPGGVSAVTATAPLSSSGGATPNIALSNSNIFDWPGRQLLNTSAVPVLDWQTYINQNITRIPVAGPSTIDMNRYLVQVDSQTDVDDENLKLFNWNAVLDSTGTNKRFGNGGAGGLGMLNIYTNHNQNGHVGFYHPINIGADFGTGTSTGTIGSIEEINIFTNIHAGYTHTGTYRGIGLFQNFEAGSTLGQYEGIRLSPNINASGVTGIFGLTFAMNISSAVSGGINMIQAQSGFSGSASYYVDVQTGSNMNSGANITGGYTSINVSPVINAASVINQFTGISVAPNTSVMTTGNVTGINIDLGNISSINKKIALNVGNGFFNSYVEMTTQPSLFIDIGHQRTTTFHINPTAPITGTDVLVSNYTTQFLLEDNFTSGPLGFGLIGTALDSQISVQLTKTADKINQVMVGASIPPIAGDGGTVTDYTGIRCFGVLNFGGNLVITNQYGLRVEDTTGGYASNYWGVFVDDPNSENYFKKSIVVGGGTKKVTNASVGFEVADKKAMKLAPMTVAECNALTAAEGMYAAISDGATHELRYYNGTAWKTVVLA
jgi:hypothetical protein